MHRGVNRSIPNVPLNKLPPSPQCYLFSVSSFLLKTAANSKLPIRIRKRRLIPWYIRFWYGPWPKLAKPFLVFFYHGLWVWTFARRYRCIPFHAPSHAPMSQLPRLHHTPIETPFKSSFLKEARGDDGFAFSLSWTLAAERESRIIGPTSTARPGPATRERTLQLIRFVFFSYKFSPFGLIASGGYIQFYSSLHPYDVAFP
ncbi:hypothetical protein BKA70DRAFT_855948 [Coprinopsis sp. MPI-PUGE-AT-0042]|nr:hypothetical protein BKA70DRAFT_855948 [Coprinopsis sp. MPI-PUGE-AT-0042]